MVDPNRILLGVNVDHVATLRQARGTRYPDPVKAALDAEQAGADGITVHLREDARHIQERDVRVMAQVLQTSMNFEMAVTDKMIDLANMLSLPEAVSSETLSLMRPTPRGEGSSADEDEIPPP